MAGSRWVAAGAGGGRRRVRSSLSPDSEPYVWIRERRSVSPFAPPAPSASLPQTQTLPREASQRRGRGRRPGAASSPALGAVTVPRSPGLLQSTKTRGGRRGSERGRQRRRAGGQLQAEPRAPAGTGPFTRRGTQSSARMLFQCGLNARAPPRGWSLSRPHPPGDHRAASPAARRQKLKKQIKIKIKFQLGSRNSASGTSDFSETVSSLPAGNEPCEGRRARKSQKYLFL
nr:uncharacterized protein LOC129054916 [Pongo abelii]